MHVLRIEADQFKKKYKNVQKKYEALTVHAKMSEAEYAGLMETMTRLREEIANVTSAKNWIEAEFARFKINYDRMESRVKDQTTRISN